MKTYDLLRSLNYMMLSGAFQVEKEVLWF